MKKMKNDRMSQHQWHQNSDLWDFNKVWSPISKKNIRKTKHVVVFICGNCIQSVEHESNRRDSMLPLCPYQMSFWNLPWNTSSTLHSFLRLSKTIKTIVRKKQVDDGASVNFHQSLAASAQNKELDWTCPSDFKRSTCFLKIFLLSNGIPHQWLSNPKTDFISLLEVFVGNDFL